MEPLQLQVVEGIQFLDPDTMQTRRGGEVFEVKRSSFWRRRINDGSVVVKESEKTSTGSGKKSKSE